MPRDLKRLLLDVTPPTLPPRLHLSPRKSLERRMLATRTCLKNQRKEGGGGESGEGWRMVKEEGEEEGEERQKAGVGWAKCACVCVFVNESVNARMLQSKLRKPGERGRILRTDLFAWTSRFSVVPAENGGSQIFFHSNIPSGSRSISFPPRC